MKERLSHISIRRTIEIIVVAAVYYAVARLSLLLAFQKTNASPVWPPSGIAFALILWRGYRVWPGIMAGAFCANMVTFLQSQAAPAPTLMVASLLIGIGNTLEAMTGRFLLERLATVTHAFTRTHDFFRFVLVALLMCLVSSAIGPTVLLLLEIIPKSIYEVVWFTWWLGDATGVLVVTPLLLTWWEKWRIQWGLFKLVEMLLLLAMLLLVGSVSFGGWFAGRNAGYPLAFAPMPLLVWAAFRFGKRGTTTVILAISAIAVWQTIHGNGPFVGGSIHESLLLLQAFVGIMTVTSLGMAVLVTERHDGSVALRNAYDELDLKIHERTSELARANEALRRENEERREVEEALVLKAQELSHSNEELEQFAYVASHDLREPLRSVSSFTQLLARRYGGALGKEGDEFIHFIVDGATRMEKLINDLLAYSRVGKKSVSASMDCEKIFSEVLANLKTSIEESRAVVTHDPLPALKADAVEWRQLFQNLLSNAIKFHGKEPPRIHISVQKQPEPGEQGEMEWMFSVEDHGIGFAPEYVERIFIIFQRLHTREEYPGTGIGLAICKKIVERHGGRIWAESTVGKGSTFHFTIPCKRVALD